MTPSTDILPAGQYRVTGEPIWGLGTESGGFNRGDVVTLPAARRPDPDGDVIVAKVGGARSEYIRASSLTPVSALVKGQRVRVADPAGTSIGTDGRPGGFVQERAFGKIGVVTLAPTRTDACAEVELEGFSDSLFQSIHPAFLTPIDDEPVTAREPLTFAAAYEKAVAHRGTPTSAKQVAKTVRLAELLIEVSA